MVIAIYPFSEGYLGPPAMQTPVPTYNGPVVELADTLFSESSAARREGSTPSWTTNIDGMTERQRWRIATPSRPVRFRLPSPTRAGAQGAMRVLTPPSRARYLDRLPTKAAHGAVPRCSGGPVAGRGNEAMPSGIGQSR